MDVVINEVRSTVELMSDDALLDPAVLRQIVRAVAAHLRDQDDARRWEEREAHVPRLRRS
jgi:hypothetical protein